MKPKMIPYDNGAILQAQQALFHLQEELNLNCISSPLHKQISLSPVVMDNGTLRTMAVIHSAITKALTSLRTSWNFKQSLRDKLSVPSSLEKALRSLQSCPSTASILDIHFFLDETGTIKVYGISTPTPSVLMAPAVINKWFHQESMKSDCIYSQLQLASVSHRMRFVEEFQSKICSISRKIWLICGKAAETDVKVIKVVLEGRVDLRQCSLKDVLCFENPKDGLYCLENDGSESKIDAFLLFVQSEELQDIAHNVLEALAHGCHSQNVINDLFTTAISTHKYICDALLEEEVEIDSVTRSILDKHVIRRGDIARTKKREYKILEMDGKTSTQCMIGTISSFDNEFCGPGLFRATSEDVSMKVKNSTILFGATQLKQCPDHIRSYAPTLKEIDHTKIRESLRNEGVALVAVGSHLGNKNELIEFLDGIKAVPLLFNKTDTIWEVKPRRNFTEQDIPAHTPLDFEAHTDASAQKSPPEYVLLSVVRADRNTGGLFSYASVEKGMSTLSVEQRQCLERLNVGWYVPPDMRQETDVHFQPVMLSQSRARLRRKSINTKHLDEETAMKFWAAFDILVDKLQTHCDENLMTVPEQSIIIINNQRFVHHRTQILDFRRHLQRVLFNIPDLN